MYLDTVPLQQASVGYGQLGTHGSLGYEGKLVQVKHQRYMRVRMIVGIKRNQTCEQARGEVIAHWDDDWHASFTLSDLTS